MSANAVWVSQFDPQTLPRLYYPRSSLAPFSVAAPSTYMWVQYWTPGLLNRKYSICGASQSWKGGFLVAWLSKHLAEHLIFDSVCKKVLCQYRCYFLDFLLLNKWPEHLSLKKANDTSSILNPQQTVSNAKSYLEIEISWSTEVPYLGYLWDCWSRYLSHTTLHVNFSLWSKHVDSEWLRWCT